MFVAFPADLTAAEKPVILSGMRFPKGTDSSVNRPATGRQGDVNDVGLGDRTRDDTASSRLRDAR
jgi:hypothetical protein